MSYEIKVNGRTANVMLVNKNGNSVIVNIDGVEYNVNVAKLEKGNYSILHNNKSYNMELIESGNIRTYEVNSFKNLFKAEIIDSETKYFRNRQHSQQDDDENVIIAPIPGRVVNVLIKPGNKVKKGQTMLIISAMKMESEFKAKKEGVVKEINVNEGQNVEANQVMVVIE